MKGFAIGGLVLVIAVLAYAFIVIPSNSTAAAEEEIKWYTFDEAVKLSEKKPKKIFIDLYTDWCGWCKRMDATTFKDPAVAKYMNANFYPVKFDAEQKEEVKYRGHTFTYFPAGNRGVHELAYSLLDGKLSYPSYVYLSEKQERITISPGYKEAEFFVKELKYIAENYYEKIPYQEYLNKVK